MPPRSEPRARGRGPEPAIRSAGVRSRPTRQPRPRISPAPPHVTGRTPRTPVVQTTAPSAPPSHRTCTHCEILLEFSQWLHIRHPKTDARPARPAYCLQTYDVDTLRAV